MRRALLLVIALLASPLALLLAGAGGPASASESPHATTKELFPSVAGAPGATPKISFPKGTPPTKLESKALVKGTGPLVAKGELLVANYVGQIWNGKVFDSSYSRKQLSGFPIGVGEVIPGWDDTLVGVHVGSRMLLVIPPVDGYGSKGESAAGITGKDDIVFVVDVVAAYSSTANAPASATAQATGATGIKVTGKVGAAPTITVAKGTKKPTAVRTVILDRGHGAAVSSGLVVIQFKVVNWSSVVEESTWTGGQPYAVNVDQTSTDVFPNDLKGIPIGSRVLIELPLSSGEGPYAFVADIVAQPKDPQS